MGRLSKAWDRFATTSRLRRIRQGRPWQHRVQRWIGRRVHRVEWLEQRSLLSFGGVGTSYYLPPHHDLYQLGGYLTEPSTARPLDIAMDYLNAHAEQLGLTSDDVLHSFVTDQYVSPDTGMTHIYLRQELNGLEIVNANMNVNVTADGRVLSLGCGFVGGVSGLGGASAPVAGPALSALQALGKTSQQLGLTRDAAPTLVVEPSHGIDQAATLTDADLSLDPIPAKLHYVATPDGVDLAWDVVLRTPDKEHWYDVAVDASDGSLLCGSDWVDSASYTVFARPTENPDDGTRTIVVDPADSAASPFGWHDTNGVPGAEFTDTRGNNVSAQEDVDANNTGGFRPDGGTDLNFDFLLDLSQAPSSYQGAAITNLFYWSNILHDIHYRYGFNEAAGNFQQTNYSGRGLGGDPVQADAQDGSGTNNANFATPPDGMAPRMQMFNFTLTAPYRDGDLESVIIVHEFGHGVSNRLVGGPANVNALDALQSGGMGEGWSDWWGLMFTQKPTDTQMAAYPVGNYVLGQAPNGPGIRRYPYSYNMGTDPLTYGSYNSSQEVHNAGEIWCSVLWDLNWLLIGKYGYNANIAAGYTGPGSAGNILALQLVMDSLKIMPVNPTFLQGRDAMLLADQTLTGGANQHEIWTAFARRGMGFRAYDGGNANATSVIENFDAPPSDPIVLAQIPRAPTPLPVSFMEFKFSEPMNPGSFSVGSDVVSFTSPDGADLKPQITTGVWVDSQTLRVSFAPQSAEGRYTMVIGPQILAADNGHAMDQSCNGTPGEVPDDQYSGDFTIKISVGPDAFGYEALPYTYENLNLVPNATGVVTLLDNVDDSSAPIPLGSRTFSFYGASYTGANQLFVSSNGMITLGGSADPAALNEDLTDFPTYPTIAPLWDDWQTDAGVSSMVLYKFDGSRLIIEWNDVPHWGFPSTRAVTFQAILQLNPGTNTSNIIFNYPSLSPGEPYFDNGASATVGIKAGGIQGPNRLLVSIDDGANPYVGTGKAIRIIKSGSISGQMFNDLDGDGVKDTGEPGMAGQTVYIDADDDGILDPGETSATTNSAGNYLLRWLPWGTYVIREVVPSGYRQTLPASGSYRVVLSSGQNVADDFGNQILNRPPVVNDQTFTLPENSPNGTVVGTVVATDPDLPYQSLTYSITAGNGSGAFWIDPASGQITVADVRQLDYETTPTFRLTVRVADNGVPVYSRTATMTVNLTNVNDPPITVDDGYTTAVETTLSVPASSGVLANDRDPEHDPITAAWVDGPWCGTLTLNPNGSFVYTPQQYFAGTDTFTYGASDPQGLTGFAMVTITVGSPGAAITMTVPTKVWEGQGTLAAAGTVGIPTARDSDLVVLLSSNKTSELRVPATVTIPAHQTLAHFDVFVQDDAAYDGSQSVKVIARAPGLVSSIGTVAVADNDVHHFTVGQLAGPLIGPIANPQTGGVAFPLEIEADDVRGERIEVYQGAATLTAAGRNGSLPLQILQQGSPTSQLVFTSGHATCQVTALALDMNVVLTVADQGRSGQTNAFDVVYGPLDHYQWSRISSPQAVDAPLTATLTACDARDFTVADFAGAVEITGWIDSGTVPTVVITETYDNTPDYVEIQNVTRKTVDTRGWVVAVNDAGSGDINAVNPVLWSLPPAMTPGQVLYRTDDEADNYWGANIWWGETTKKGWAMILDGPKSESVVDFAVWGYSAYEIRTMHAAIAGHEVRIGSAWSGPGVAYGGSAGRSLQRTADRDGNGALDFSWDFFSKGTQNSGLVIPFGGGTSAIPLTPLTTGVFRNGTWTGSITVHQQAAGMYLRANDGCGHLGYGDSFNVAPPRHFGSTTPGFYNPANSAFYLKNSNSGGIADTVFSYGPAGLGWITITGDWDGNGTDTVGLYNPAASTFYLKNTHSGGSADRVFQFGPGGLGWRPIAGDWDGDGTVTVGLYNPATSTFYLKNTHSGGGADRVFQFGPGGLGWTPIAGDWDGDGTTTVGLYAPSASMFFLKNTHSGGNADKAFQFGPAGLGWRPIAGDWDGDGTTTVGLYASPASMFFLKNTHGGGSADTTFQFGPAGAGWVPIVGDWDGSGLHAADGVLSAARYVAPLTQAALQPIVTEALNRWASLGLSGRLLDSLARVEFVITDLPGSYLGRAYGDVICIDRDAAGHGWFVDTTPGADEEFRVLQRDRELHALDPQAVDRVDLLSVVEHELGHVAGLEDVDFSVHSLMSGRLATGVRRLAARAEIDAIFAAHGPLGSC